MILQFSVCPSSGKLPQDFTAERVRSLRLSTDEETWQTILELVIVSLKRKRDLFDEPRFREIANL